MMPSNLTLLRETVIRTLGIGIKNWNDFFIQMNSSKYHLKRLNFSNVDKLIKLCNSNRYRREVKFIFVAKISLDYCL